MNIMEKNRTENGCLYLVATPIGNLADISDRAKKVLSEVSFIAAEDTRNSLKLLNCLGIRNELVSYHEHNRRAAGERIIARLLGGESCALITDAGMPAISDPGEDLVRLASDAGVTVSVVPGACAAVSALALSALSTRRFTFIGFLPVQKKERAELLDSIAREQYTVILYEAPHKLRDTLADLLATLGGERKISLARELTKLNEDVMRTTLAAAVAHYTEAAPRGEYVLVLEGCLEAGVMPQSASATAAAELLSLTPEQHVAHYEATGLARMDAIKAAARDRGMTKSELYKLLHNCLQ